MRILQLAPLWEAVPPPAYGGTEAVVSLLTEELVRQGHDVILAASGDSHTSATHLATYHRSLRRAEELADRNPYDWMHIAMALKEARDCDIIHNHAGELPMSMSHVIDTPMLTTLHCLTTPDTQFVWDRYAGAYNTISRSQRPPLAPGRGAARFMGHVYNAVDVESFPFQADKGDDLLFLSRVAPEKGPHLAVQVARKVGRRLIIAGKVDAYDRRFFDEVMRDLIDGEQIVFFGEADAQQKRELYRKAYCVLMPLTWEEPFGLVMPEAMACGTPVIALRRGSAPELIAHGETGFVVDTVDEMADAVEMVGTINPRACRERVRALFSPETMARDYLRVYDEVLERASVPATFRVPASAAAVEPDEEEESVVA
ncbi:MAG TPA: glycosyltransferase family 4 protein [Dehalococcoidia bacterium]|nr:glycosyltransferase family 4 protein [Dehalococcoidia bacterium]